MMCKATVVYEDKLGKRRCGWCCYLPKSRDFTFWSDKQIKDMLKSGELVNGLCLSDSGEIQMDESFTMDLLSKAGLATFTPIKPEGETLSNKYYAVVKVIKSKSSTTYELVTNRCGLELVSEAKLKALLTLINVGGVRVDKGHVLVHPAVAVEGDTADAEESK